MSQSPSLAVPTPEARFAESDRRIHVQILSMLEQSNALIGVYDTHEVLQYTNAAFRAAYFIEPGETVDWRTLMRRNFEARRGTVIETDDIDSWLCSVRSRRGKAQLRQYESDLHDGRFIWVTETMLPNGWISYVGTDVTKLNESDRMLRLTRDAALREATTDELTGVSNRRHILGKLAGLLDSGRLQPGCACMVDIDHFKPINDTYGHGAGDETLVEVARAMRNCIRLKDSFGRIGGEEFLILFDGLKLEKVLDTMGRLQNVVRGLHPISTARDVKISFSGGVTELRSGDDVDTVISRCDRALYQAKAAGRDRVVQG